MSFHTRGLSTQVPFHTGALPSTITATTWLILSPIWTGSHLNPIPGGAKAVVWTHHWKFGPSAPSRFQVGKVPEQVWPGHTTGALLALGTFFPEMQALTSFIAISSPVSTLMQV